MGMVAPTDEKRALEEELAEARALVDRGAVEAALDVLARARRSARALGDADALGEVGRLGGSVWRSAPGRGRRPGLGAWSLVVVASWVVASVVLAVGFGFSRGWSIFVTVFVCASIAAVVWLSGLMLYALWRWVREAVGGRAGW